MALYKFKNFSPKIASNCFIAPSAEIIGNVEITEGASVWFNATIRADMNAIHIGKNTSIQDNCVVHVDKDYPVEIGNNVVIGHGAIVHSAKIGNNCIIGMGAILLSGSKIGNNCIIGAGTVVTEETEIPDNSIAIGTPAKVIKQVSDAHIARIKRNVANYMDLNKEYLRKENLEKI